MTSQANSRTPYSDQEALNVACDGDWQPLDPKWNLQTLYHPGALDRARRHEQPGIVHFITGDKPSPPFRTGTQLSATHTGVAPASRAAPAIDCVTAHRQRGLA